MFGRYREILSLPGALKFSIAGVFARFPMALVGISIILMVKQLYGNYALAGAVSAAGVISFAVGAPLLSRLVDAHGQARIMVPSLIISGISLSILTVAAMNQADPWILLVTSAIGGATSGSMGALVRARWAFVTDRPGQIQAAYSLEAAFDEVVFVIGPVLATLMATSIHPTAGLWLAVLLVVFGGLWFLSQRKTEPPVIKHDAHVGGRSVMLNPAMIVLALTYVGAGALFGANDLAVVAFTEEHGQPGLAGVLLAVFSFGSLIGALVYGARTWRWPLWKLFGVGVFVLGLGVSTFVFANSLVMLAIIMVLTGLVVAPTMTNVSTVVQRIMPSSRLTEGLAWMSTAMNIGVSIGAGVAGPVVDVQGAHGGFVVVIGSAWLMVLAMALGLRTLRRETEELPRAIDTGIMAVKPTPNVKVDQ
ncbi:MFS transporter [Actinomyces sp. F1_1611]